MSMSVSQAVLIDPSAIRGTPHRFIGNEAAVRRGEAPAIADHQIDSITKHAKRGVQRPPAPELATPRILVGDPVALMTKVAASLEGGNSVATLAAASAARHIEVNSDDVDERVGERASYVGPRSDADGLYNVLVALLSMFMEFSKNQRNMSAS